MKNITINMTQCTAERHIKSKTVKYIYIVKDYGEKVIIFVQGKDRQEFFRCYPPDCRQLLYRVTISHPHIMWGTTEEIQRDFNNAISDELPELEKYQIIIW